MKKFVALLLACSMLFAGAFADVKSETIAYIVELINKYAEQLDFLEVCKYDESADVLMLEMTFDRTKDVYDGLSASDKADLIELYMEGDGVMNGSLEIAEVETMTVSIAKTQDNIPFFLCINGVNQSWILE